MQGDKPGSNVKIPATGATLEQFEGIVINDVNREMNMDGELLIQPKTTVGVMQYAASGCASRTASNQNTEIPCI